jgi:hypothetical protein
LQQFNPKSLCSIYKDENIDDILINLGDFILTLEGIQLHDSDLIKSTYKKISQVIFKINIFKI